MHELRHEHLGMKTAAMPATEVARHRHWFLVELERRLGDTDQEHLADVLVEVEEHLRCLYDAHLEVGSTPEEADRAAVAQFGTPAAFCQGLRPEPKRELYSRLTCLIGVSWMAATLLMVLGAPYQWMIETWLCLSAASAVALIVASWKAATLQWGPLLRRAMPLVAAMALLYSFAWIPSPSPSPWSIIQRWEAGALAEQTRAEIANMQSVIATSQRTIDMYLKGDPLQLVWQRMREGKRGWPGYVLVRTGPHSTIPTLKEVEFLDYEQATQAASRLQAEAGGLADGISYLEGALARLESARRAPLPAQVAGAAWRTVPSIAALFGLLFVLTGLVWLVRRSFDRLVVRLTARLA